jgi:putative transposase
MSFYQARHQLPSRFRLVLSSFMQTEGLAFADVLPEEQIQQAFEDEDANFGQDDDAIYTPSLTLWAFLSQSLFKEEARSCAAAVARVVVLMVALGQDPPSDDTGTYCRARAKLSEKVIRRLMCETADACEHAIPEDWLWRGRSVKLVDGSTISMPDTEANQEAYPQHGCQEEGVGFPIARIVVMLSLATGMACDLAIAPYQGKQTGETALFRQLMGRLRLGDIVVVDRYHCTYFMICLLMELGVDFVVRLHRQRKADFRRGRRLGQGDHVVTWTRSRRPEWMDEATYQRMPETIEVREVAVQVKEPGFRVDSFVVVTTLLDAEEYTQEDVAELYHKRWLVELDLKSIKCTMGMGILRCKTPHMVHQEIWTCLLAYNLIRKVNLEAALQAGLSPRQLSVTAALQKIGASYNTLVQADETVATRLIQQHLQDMSGHRVGNRPNRVEPRAIKRRPKRFPLLTKPRDEARADLLAGNV